NASDTARNPRRLDRFASEISSDREKQFRICISHLLTQAGQNSANLMISTRVQHPSRCVQLAELQTSWNCSLEDSGTGLGFRIGSTRNGRQNSFVLRDNFWEMIDYVTYRERNGLPSHRDATVPVHCGRFIQQLEHQSLGNVGLQSTHASCNHLLNDELDEQEHVSLFDCEASEQPSLQKGGADPQLLSVLARWSRRHQHAYRYEADVDVGVCVSLTVQSNQAVGPAVTVAPDDVHLVVLVLICVQSLSNNMLQSIRARRLQLDSVQNKTAIFQRPERQSMSSRFNDKTIINQLLQPSICSFVPDSELSGVSRILEQQMQDLAMSEATGDGSGAEPVLVEVTEPAAELQQSLGSGLVPHRCRSVQRRRPVAGQRVGGDSRPDEQLNGGPLAVESRGVQRGLAARIPGARIRGCQQQSSEHELLPELSSQVHRRVSVCELLSACRLSSCTTSRWPFPRGEVQRRGAGLRHQAGVGLGLEQQPDRIPVTVHRGQCSAVRCRSSATSGLTLLRRNCRTLPTLPSMAALFSSGSRFISLAMPSLTDLGLRYANILLIVECMKSSVASGRWPRHLRLDAIVGAFARRPERSAGKTGSAGIARLLRALQQQDEHDELVPLKAGLLHSVPDHLGDVAGSAAGGCGVVLVAGQGLRQGVGQNRLESEAAEALLLFGLHPVGVFQADFLRLAPTAIGKVAQRHQGGPAQQAANNRAPRSESSGRHGSATSEMNRNQAASRIQRAWLGYKNRQVFRLLKCTVAAAEHSLTHEILRKLAPKEADFFSKDQNLLQLKIRFRFDLPGHRLSVKYVTGKGTIRAETDAAAQSAKLMGNRKYYDLMLQDELMRLQHQVADETDVVTVKDFMRLLAVTDETGADMGGKANTWRQLTSQAAPRHTVFRDVFDFLATRRMTQRLQRHLPLLTALPSSQEVRREQLRVLAEVEAPRLTAEDRQRMAARKQKWQAAEGGGMAGGTSRRSSRAVSRANKMRDLYLLSGSDSSQPAGDNHRHDNNNYDEDSWLRRDGPGGEVRGEEGRESLFEDDGDEEEWDEAEAEMLYEWTKELTEALKMAMADLKNRVQTMRNEFEDKTAEIEEIRTKLKEALEALDAEREDQERRVAVLEREIDTASRRLAEAEQQLVDTQDQAELTETERNSREKASNEQEATVDELEIKLKEAKNRLDESSRLLEEESRRLKATEAEADRVEAKADAAEATLDELTRTLADEQEQVKEFEQRCSKASEAEDEQNTAAAQLKTRFAEALERAEAAETELARRDRELERLQEDCRKQDAMAADIESELQAGLQVLEEIK
uniref:Pecanex-like protein n=1 Tax=Macrostomum lignano TaxID=282301 RepID=A0A1I8GSA1_9PLAT